MPPLQCRAVSFLSTHPRACPLAHPYFQHTRLRIPSRRSARCRRHCATEHVKGANTLGINIVALILPIHGENKQHRERSHQAVSGHTAAQRRSREEGLTNIEAEATSARYTDPGALIFACEHCEYRYPMPIRSAECAHNSR